MVLAGILHIYEGGGGEVINEGRKSQHYRIHVVR